MEISPDSISKGILINTQCTYLLCIYYSTLHWPICISCYYSLSTHLINHSSMINSKFFNWFSWCTYLTYMDKRVHIIWSNSGNWSWYSPNFPTKESWFNAGASYSIFILQLKNIPIWQLRRGPQVKLHA